MSDNRKNMFILLILSTFVVHTTSKKCFLDNYHVHILNKFPPNSTPLLLSCASADNYLGNHTLYLEGDFNFEFCESFFHNTLFHCGFTWKSKYVGVNVYTSASRMDCISHSCYWSTRSDGIYFSRESPLTNWTKRFRWP